MRVRLSTTISTIIEIDPGNTTEFETARREIFKRFSGENEVFDSEAEEFIQAQQANAVLHDTIIGTDTTHTFEEVKELEADV